MAINPIDVMANDAKAAPRTPAQQNFLDRLQAAGLSEPFPLAVYRVIALVQRQAARQVVLDELKVNFPKTPPYARVVAVAWVNEQYAVADRTAIAQPFSPTGRALPAGTVGFELDTAIFPIVKPVLADPKTQQPVSVPTPSLLQFINFPEPPPAVKAPGALPAPDHSLAVAIIPDYAPDVAPPRPQIQPVMFQQYQRPGERTTTVEVINPNQQTAAAASSINPTVLILGGGVLLVALMVVMK